MANRSRFLVGLLMVAMGPCAAEGLRTKSVDPVREKTTWWLHQDGLVARMPGGEGLVALPGWHWVGGQHACPPALGIGPRGEAVVTSNVAASVWKVDPLTLEVTVHELELDSDRDKDVGFSTLRYSPEEGAWVAFSAAHGSTWRIDPALTRAKRISYKPEWRTSCATN